MQQNVGSMDQYIRYVIGMSLVTAGIAFGSLWGILGVIPIMTALLSWCPPYSLLGFNTNK